MDVFQLVKLWGGIFVSSYHKIPNLIKKSQNFLKKFKFDKVWVAITNNKVEKWEKCMLIWWIFYISIKNGQNNRIGRRLPVKLINVGYGIRT